MMELNLPFAATSIEADDTAQGFSCEVRALDDYFARHALANDRAGISRAYVLRLGTDDQRSLPSILGYYTLSMATAESSQVAGVIDQKLPRYPMPVALIGRLAVDHRAQGRRIGEKLLMDALRRVVAASRLVACTGVVVDAKDEGAERFYTRYDFVTVTHESWPRRMFLPIGVVRAAFADE